MTPSDHITPEFGRVTRYVEVPELLIRKVQSYGLTEELDGAFYDDENEAETTDQREHEIRLQGRLVNATKHRLSDIKYDVSYYDTSGSFLGLSRSGFLEEDELDVDDHLPIDMEIEIPEATVKCVFNVRAKKPGFIGRLFWG